MSLNLTLNNTFNSTLFLQDDLGLSETTYELSYNAACTLIGQGQLTEAMNKLQEAEG